MKNSIRNLIITAALVSGMFGIVYAQAEVSGEFSTDVTIGDATAFSSPYSGLNISGDGWELSTNLSDGNVMLKKPSITGQFQMQSQQHLVVKQNHMESLGGHTDLLVIHLYLLQETTV